MLGFRKRNRVSAEIDDEGYVVVGSPLESDLKGVKCAKCGSPWQVGAPDGRGGSPVPDAMIGDKYIDLALFCAACAVLVLAVPLTWGTAFGWGWGVGILIFNLIFIGVCLYHTADRS